MALIPKLLSLLREGHPHAPALAATMALTTCGQALLLLLLHLNQPKYVQLKR